MDERTKVPTVPADQGCIAQSLNRDWRHGFCPEKATQYAAALDGFPQPFCDEHAARAIDAGAMPCDQTGKPLPA